MAAALGCGEPPPARPRRVARPRRAPPADALALGSVALDHGRLGAPLTIELPDGRVIVAAAKGREAPLQHPEVLATGRPADPTFALRVRSGTAPLARFAVQNPPGARAEQRAALVVLLVEADGAVLAYARRYPSKAPLEVSRRFWEPP